MNKGCITNKHCLPPTKVDIGAQKPNRSGKKVIKRKMITVKTIFLQSGFRNSFQSMIII